METNESETGVKAYKHKPYIVPEGMSVFELCLITGKIRAAEWHDVQPKKRKVAFWKRFLIAVKMRKPLPKPKPVKQLVEYDDCIYVPAQNMKVAKKQLDHIFRKNNAKIKIK